MQRLKRGEELAFDYFFHRYFPLMVTFASRFVPNNVLAEEIVQDVFYKVWERRSSFANAQALKAFLYISTKNASYNEISKFQNRYKHQEAYASENELTEQPVLQEIIRTEVYASLSVAIQTLPGQCRKIIQLLFEEGKKPIEIADELGISISTVNSQKARGLMLLKQLLKGKDLDLLLLIIFLYF
ncbi:RNA polymerase sigma-70 factor [Sphingobacterium sp. SGG-5]|nr:RNA polymerase sigma-70 factor [Sphingobacterium sp. SGG-5]